MSTHQRRTPLWRHYAVKADALLSSIPGVTWRREVNQHSCLYITYAGQTRKVFYPGSPRYQRGAIKHVMDIKKVLRELGVDLKERTTA
jgi:hypothetical protein